MNQKDVAVPEDEMLDMTEPEVEVEATVTVVEPDSFNLGGTLWAMFQQAEKDKLDVEGRFMDDLRQYKGIYSDDIRKKIKSGRSKANIALTRTKVNVSAITYVCDLEPRRNWRVPLHRADRRRYPVFPGLDECTL